MSPERRQVFFEGQVQGVGFRATTAHLASAFPVTGHVRNLEDGRVEVVVEGPPASLDEFLGAIAREFGDRITRITATVRATSGPPLAGFTIRH